MFAVSAHALLLLLPGWNNPVRPEPVPFSIQLVPTPRPPALESPLQEARTLKPRAPRPEPAALAQARVEAADQAPAPTADMQSAPLPKPAPTRLTAVRLLDSARMMEVLLPEQPDLRQLGQAPPLAIPSNWRPAIVLAANRFDGMVAPARTEILDRWLAADGSHNVVLETPGGHTLCGHALAWNPMQPLVEHLMLFRPCGGGGKRAFEMPDRGDLPDYGTLR